MPVGFLLFIWWSYLCLVTWKSYLVEYQR